MLGSSILIEAERQRLDVARFLKHVVESIGEPEAALCSIRVAELAHGIYRAKTSERRQARRAFSGRPEGHVVIYPITTETAEPVARIIAEASQQGISIHFADLL